MSGANAYMARAIGLARRGWYSTPPNPRVGCVLVREDAVIGEGWHARAGDAHAELNALRDARSRHGGAEGATAYVTLEPCCHYGRTAPCTQALIDAGVARVVIGMRDPNPQVGGAGVDALRAAGIEVETGLLEPDCEALNPGFIKRMTERRPRIRIKLAASLDGRTAAANGESRWITGTAARDDVHRLRAESGAVAVGSGTALADDPGLNVRLPGEWRQPMRVVLDSRLRLEATARMLTLPGRTLVLTATETGPDWDALAVAGADIRAVPAGRDGRIDLGAAMRVLADEQVNDLLVEAGATLAGAFLAADLVDELILYMAPQMIGDGGRPLVQLPGARTLSDRVDLTFADCRAVGRDWRITAQRQGS